MADDIITRAEAALQNTIPAPWFWAGNTDHNGDVELRGRIPGMGHVDVLRTCPRFADETQLGAEYDQAAKEYGLDECITRDDYIEAETDHPRHWLAFGRPDAAFVEYGRDHAVYEVARNQNLPDNTPRHHPQIYRADVVDIRNAHARLIAAAPALIQELITEVKQLRELIENARQA